MSGHLLIKVSSKITFTLVDSSPFEITNAKDLDAIWSIEISWLELLTNVGNQIASAMLMGSDISSALKTDNHAIVYLILWPSSLVEDCLLNVSLKKLFFIFQAKVRGTQVGGLDYLVRCLPSRPNHLRNFRRVST